MWHQRLHWVTYSLIGVLVIAGSFALLGCSGDDDNNGSQAQGQGQGPSTVFLDPAVDRVNMNPTNLTILAGRVDPDGTIVSPRGIVTDVSTFAFDNAVAPGNAE